MEIFINETKSKAIAQAQQYRGINLNCPSMELINYLKLLNFGFAYFLPKLFHAENILENLCFVTSVIEFNLPVCQNFPKERFAKFFLRTRLYHLLKIINEKKRQETDYKIDLNVILRSDLCISTLYFNDPFENDPLEL